MFSTCDSPAARRKNRASVAADDRGIRPDGDDPAVNLRGRKAIVGEEARRGIQDEKAVAPARNTPRQAPRVRAERRGNQEAVTRRMAAAVEAGKKSKDGNDDIRREDERSMEAEERKTTNESPQLRGKGPSEDIRVARYEGRHSRRRRWEAAEAERIDVAAVADGFGDDAIDEFSKTVHRRLTNWQ